MAAYDLWTHHYCLGCDKQTDYTTYCSESCRLADFEKTSSGPCSGTSSPGAIPAPSYPWEPRRSCVTTTGITPSSSKFYLAPAYDFANAQPYGAAAPNMPAHRNTFAAPSGSSDPCSASQPQQQQQQQHHYYYYSQQQQQRALSPSSSYSSLCSIQSSSTVANPAAGDSVQLSEKARKELREYAISFEHVRLQRRRSY